MENRINEIREKTGVNILENAIRYRFAWFSPQGELYSRYVVEYKDGSTILYSLKFNNNMFVGDRIDIRQEKNPSLEVIKQTLRKTPYNYGTGLRKYITV